MDNSLDFIPEEADATIKKLLQINELDLEREMIVCAGQYEYYAKMATDTELILNQWKLHVGVYEARLAQQFRSEVQPIFDRKGGQTGTRPTTAYETPGDLKRAYFKDEAWISMKQKELQLEYNATLLSKVARAFEIKSSQIQSLNKRQLGLRNFNNNNNNNNERG